MTAEISDDWLTSTDEEMRNYSPLKFYIRATDGNGHSAKVQVKMHEQEAAQLAKWANDPRTSYRTMQDVMRDAIVHRLHTLHDMYDDGVIDTELSDHTLIAQMDTETRRNQGRLEVMHKFQEMAQSLLNEGRVDEAAELRNGFDDATRLWPDGARQRAASMSVDVGHRIRSAVRARGEQ